MAKERSIQVLQSNALLTVEEGRFVIERFETEDQDVVAYFTELKPETRQARFETALKVGVISIRTIGLTEKIDYIQKEFNLLNSKFNETVGKTMDTLDEKFEDIFGEKGKVSGVLEEHFGEDGKLVKEIFDPMREGSPLYELRVELQNQIQNLRTDLGISEAVEAVKAKTPLKGYDFEDLCEKVLAKIARQYGDILERTSDKVGKVKLSKKGDFVVTAGGKKGRKIVFEVKDVSTFSIPGILRTLDEAMKNREASYGVFLVKDMESLPESAGWFEEYNGNQLVCALSSEKFEKQELHEEIMYIAYKWAKAKVLLEAVGEEKVDPVFVRDRVSDIKTKLANLTAIRTQCGNIEEASEKIRNLTRKIETEVNEELSSILTALAGAR